MSKLNPGGLIRGSYNPSNAALQVDYMVIAGGGAGGGLVASASNGSPGGGGAGGMLVAYGYAVTPGIAYTITVGAGGAGVNGTVGGNGSNSIWNVSAVGGGATITSTGGGGGGGYSSGNGANGGSGGGPVGGNTPGTGVSGQGSAGGTPLYNGAGVGGGGAGATTYSLGVNPDRNFARSSISAGGSGMIGFDGVVYASGGAGGNNGADSLNGGNANTMLFPSPGGGAKAPPGTGYLGGAPYRNMAGYNGTAGTGGGGSGGSNGYGTNYLNNAPGGNGGSGVVVLRTLRTLNPAANLTGQPTVEEMGNYRYYYFYGSGTITF